MSNYLLRKFFLEDVDYSMRYNQVLVKEYIYILYKLRNKRFYNKVMALIIYIMH